MPGTGNHQARYIANPYDARDDGKSSVWEFEEQGECRGISDCLFSRAKPGRQGCLHSHAVPPARVIVVNILLHEKGIENGELALVI